MPVPLPDKSRRGVPFSWPQPPSLRCVSQSPAPCAYPTSACPTGWGLPLATPVRSPPEGAKAFQALATDKEKLKKACPYVFYREETTRHTSTHWKVLAPTPAGTQLGTGRWGFAGACYSLHWGR